MNKDAVLRNAFDWVCWQEDDFDVPGSADLYRLSNAISSSVETVAVHSLHRLHMWLWPTVAKTQVGDAFDIGGVRFSVVERLHAVDREDSKTGVLVETAGRSWKLAWFDMEGREPLVAVGVRNDDHYAGYEPSANCELQEADRYKGALNAQGDDVGEMFDLFAILRPLMPEALLKVKDGSHNDWKLDGAEGILEFDGGVGGEAATDLYRMAEQYASARVFDWARDRIAQACDFLSEQGAILGREALKYSDRHRLACAVDTAYAGRIAFVESQFPHRDLFDRYLVWAELDDDGQVAVVSFHAVADGETIEDVVDLMNEGALSATAPHDYPTGVTTFAPGRSGFNHIAHFATAVALVSNMARHFDPSTNADSELTVDEDLRAGRP
ncbi:hypothetical protein [Rhizobium leguminosarum]|uniref:hypothetical protein n=1 Tax=Rhizobium leguminosarum TaxID=384 RepID=UPI002E11B129|nr:hypothetical protein U8Q02_39815 [Rhizobium leguminosarum]